MKNPFPWNPDTSDYKLILTVMPANTPLSAAQIARRTALPTKQVRSMLGELVRYGLIKTTIDGYVKRNPAIKRHRKPIHKKGGLLSLALVGGLAWLILKNK